MPPLPLPVCSSHQCIPSRCQDLQDPHRIKARPCKAPRDGVTRHRQAQYVSLYPLVHLTAIIRSDHTGLYTRTVSTGQVTAAHRDLLHRTIVRTHARKQCIDNCGPDRPPFLQLCINTTTYQATMPISEMRSILISYRRLWNISSQYAITLS